MTRNSTANRSSSNGIPNTAAEHQTGTGGGRTTLSVIEAPRSRGRRWRLPECRLGRWRRSGSCRNPGATTELAIVTRLRTRALSTGGELEDRNTPRLPRPDAGYSAVGRTGTGGEREREITTAREKRRILASPVSATLAGCVSRKPMWTCSSSQGKIFVDSGHRTPKR